MSKVPGNLFQGAFAAPASSMIAKPSHTALYSANDQTFFILAKRKSHIIVNLSYELLR